MIVDNLGLWKWKIIYILYMRISEMRDEVKIMKTSFSEWSKKNNEETNHGSRYWDRLVKKKEDEVNKHNFLKILN